VIFHKKLLKFKAKFSQNNPFSSENFSVLLSIFVNISSKLTFFLQAMKKIFFSSLFICLFFSISAQELVDFSQYFKEADLEGGFYLYDFKKKAYK